MQSVQDNEVLEADVLILGTGAAGCCAAVAAKERGAKVLMVDKAKLEGSGSICGGNDHFMANLNTGPDWDTDEVVANSIKKMHEGVNAEILNKRWIKVIPTIMKLLEDSGLEFARNPDGSYVRTTGFAQPGPWWLNIKNGWYIKKLLAKKMRSMDITILDNVMITKLLTHNRKISGAVGFNVLDGRHFILQGKTVVLALGNDANRVTNNSTNRAFNTWGYPYNTGSNTVLAYEAGVKVRNLEFREAATLLPKGFGCPGMNGMNSMGGHELNALGERFMGKYEPVHWENTVRPKQIAATYQELIQGKGPPFYMDMRHLSKEDNDFLQNVLMPGDKATFLDYLNQKGITFATDPLEVEISEIHIGGRLVIHENLESTIDGLFSACNFHFLSGAMCGGYSAGTEAADKALKSKDYGALNNEEIVAEKKRTFAPLNKKTGIKPREYEDLIRQVMTYYMGFIRNEKGIDTALEKLNLIENHFDEVKSSDLHELMRTHEAYHLLKHCQLSVTAVKHRKESGRTIYKRSDYPELNEEMNKCIELWQEHGQMKVAFGPPL